MRRGKEERREQRQVEQEQKGERRIDHLAECSAVEGRAIIQWKCPKRGVIGRQQQSKQSVSNRSSDGSVLGLHRSGKSDTYTSGLSLVYAELINE